MWHESVKREVENDCMTASVKVDTRRSTGKKSIRTGDNMNSQSVSPSAPSFGFSLSVSQSISLSVSQNVLQVACLSVCLPACMLLALCTCYFFRYFCDFKLKSIFIRAFSCKSSMY